MAFGFTPAPPPHTQSALPSSFGPRSIAIAKQLPNLAKLLVDPNENVRESACGALVEAYRHVGNRIRTDLAKNKSGL